MDVSPRPGPARAFLLVGLTGGIASGKSSVSRQLVELGCRLIDADVLAREVVVPGAPAWRTIVEEFGRDVAGPDGQLDRKRLGALVFADPARRKVLEGITHPAIVARRQAILDGWAAEGFDGVVVLDIPLLIEVGGAGEVDRVVVVYAAPDAQLERLMARDGFVRAEAERRVASQMSLAEKVRRADFVVDNSGESEETRAQVRAVHAALLAEHRARRAAAGSASWAGWAGRGRHGRRAAAGGLSGSTFSPTRAWRRASWKPWARPPMTSCARSAPGRAP